MGEGVGALTDLVFDVAPAAAALSVVVALAMIACRQPVRRRSLARAGLVGLLLLLPLRAWNPLGRLDLGEPVHRVRLLLSPGPAGADSVATTPGGGDSRFGRLPALAYLGAAGLGLGWLGLGWYGSGWLVRRASGPSRAVLAFYNSLPYPGRKRPRLRVSPRIGRPVLVGVARPTILIPRHLDRPEARDRLRVSLLHELSHAEAADPWFLLVGGVAQAVWFFLPPLWWIRAQMRIDQEYLADRSVAEGFGTTAYASSLLLWFRGNGGPTPRAIGAPTAGQSAAGTTSTLGRRVVMLLQCPFEVELKAPTWWAWAAPALVLAATLGASSLRFDRPSAAGSARVAGRASASANRLFRSARIVLGASKPGSDGRVKPVQLPVALPGRFELRFQIQGTAESLAQTRAVGLRLGPSSGPLSPEPWHDIRIARGPQGVSLQVDGHPVPVRREESDALKVGRLAFEPPPHRSVAVRDLVLSW